MAHNLARKADGSAAMFSLKEPAWHGLGTIIDKPIQDTEVLELAGLNWIVEKKPLYHAEVIDIGGGETQSIYHQVDGWCSMTRSDNGVVLGPVRDSYEPVQNYQIIEVARGIAGVDHDLIWETAGALGKGETVWFLVRMPDLMIRLGKDDTVVPYMLFTNGHIYNHMLGVVPTLTRVVCQNTQRAALHDAAMLRARNRRKKKKSLSGGFMIRHTKGITKALEDIQKAYAGTLKAVERTKEAYEILARKDLTDELFRQIIKKTWESVDESEPDRDEPGEEAKPGDESERAKAMREANEKKRYDTLSAILASPTCQLEGTKDTIFSALQSITQYIDHERPTQQRRAISDQMARFESSQFGNGADIKDRALVVALEAAGAL
jgi:phage/plasmid-like protein (TIGR03299 family)